LVSIESISSIKIILGDYIAAKVNRVRMSFSLSPSHLEVNVLALMLKKLDLHSVATALASSVFPFPGGPYNRIPFVGALMPVKSSGLNLG
jgi:hypothetical protein